jgi:SAM-dependent methyltransferase
VSGAGEVPSDECRRWNERYAAAACFFGDRPSPFLVATLAARALSGGGARRALCLGEGEGRDAVYLAQNGWIVTAVDGAAVGLEKLRARAADAKLAVTTSCADLGSYEPPRRAFHLVSSFYCHLEPAVRRAVLSRAAAALVPGGLLVMEGFTSAQRANGRTSGGPRDASLLFDPEEIRGELAGLFDSVVIEERIVDIDYGRHSGPADIVQVVAAQPSGDL